MKYLKPHYQKPWQVAENECLERGGHLASVKNIAERDELRTGSFQQSTWLGGTDAAIGDVWVWPDGSLFGDRKCSDFIEDLSEPCNQWAKSYPKGGKEKNCLAVKSGSWTSANCEIPKPFVCQIGPSILHTDEAKHMNLTLSDLDFSTIELWLTKKLNSEESKVCDAPGPRPGFTVKWNTAANDNQPYGVMEALGKILGDKGHYLVYLTKQYSMHTMIASKGIVRKAREHEMTDKDIWSMVKSWKREVVHRKLVKCGVSNVVIPNDFKVLFGDIKTKIPTDRPKINYTETDDDVSLSFDIFSYLVYCQTEAMELQIFFENLIGSGNVPNILQGSMNIVKMEFAGESLNKAQQLIFKELTALFNLNLPQILSKMYDADITEMARISNDKVLNSGTEEPGWDTVAMEVASAISNHPVAVQNEHGYIQPSAFIPFCSFGAKLIGKEVPNMTFPVCDIFYPTVYEGQQCYRVDVKMI